MWRLNNWRGTHERTQAIHTWWLSLIPAGCTPLLFNPTRKAGKTPDDLMV